MVEKISPVKNPLTIIAIFAGIAEISGTIILPFLVKDLQSIYVWFLMGFPLLLILLFFLTLNFNHKVLYAPSDFQDESNFLKLFSRPSPKELAEKLSDELKDEEQDESQVDNTKDKKIISYETKGESDQSSYKELIHKDKRVAYLLAEELVLNSIAKEFNAKIVKQLSLKGKNSQFIFDGVIEKDNKFYAIEVKYFHSKFDVTQVRRTAKRIAKVIDELGAKYSNSFNLIIGIAINFDLKINPDLKNNLEKELSKFLFPIDIKYYNLQELEKEYL